MTIPISSRDIYVTVAAADAARKGHPWIWRAGVTRGLDQARAGDVGRVRAPDGATLGHALVDPDSPIALRMWTHGDEQLSNGFIQRCVDRAFAIRRDLFADGTTTAYRLLNGEGDRMPGFVLDKYGTTAILRTDGAAVAPWIPTLTTLLWPALEAIGVTSLAHRTSVRGTAPVLTTLAGDDPPPQVTVTEYGIPFQVDIAKGQKTGAFLDQRDNRKRVGEIARGRKVLNLFSYAGGFSLTAARGGALRVTSVDMAAEAHATAQSSFKLAGVDPKGHAFVTADAFQFLESAKKRGETWDLIISDPPSFAPREKAVGTAVTAYRKLHRACAGVLSDGGTFCAASCSSHIDMETFSATLDDVTLGRHDLRIVEAHGPPPDHPTTASWLEGRYLKFVVMR